MSNKITALFVDLITGLVGLQLAWFLMAPNKPNEHDTLNMMLWMVFLGYPLLLAGKFTQPRPVNEPDKRYTFLDHWRGGFVTGFSLAFSLLWWVDFVNRPGFRFTPHPDFYPGINDLMGEGWTISGVYVDTFVFCVIALIAICVRGCWTFIDYLPTEADIYRFYLELKQRKLEREGGSNA